MKAKRSVSDIDSSSPRNSPNCLGLVCCSRRKELKSAGRSRTTPAATQKARPCPTLRSSISAPRVANSALCMWSRKTGCRGTKKGTQEVVRSPTSPMKPPCESRNRSGRTSKLPPSMPLSISLVPASLQRDEGVAPLLFLAVMSARLRNSDSTRGRRPIIAATCNGVQPAESTQPRGAFWRSSSNTTALLPLRQAVCSSVVPWESCASKSAPMARSHLTAQMFDVPANRNASWSSGASPSSVSLKIVPAGSQAGSVP
mmetsp:Transcript_130682/g.364110  ORF Transcript_130682/g.364110 Transcript_130682/m.364110 type:complete len:257 (+) Transcript_130682:1492-2262(+)